MGIAISDSTTWICAKMGRCGILGIALILSGCALVETKDDIRVNAAGAKILVIVECEE